MTPWSFVSGSVAAAYDFGGLPTANVSDVSEGAAGMITVFTVRGRCLDASIGKSMKLLELRNKLEALRACDPPPRN